MTKQRKLAYLALLIHVAILGAALPLAKPALTHIDPAQFLFLRMLLASILIGPFFLYTLAKTGLSLKHFIIISLTEIATFLGLYLVYIGLKYTDAIQGSLIINTNPIFITLAGIVLLKEKEEKNEWLGLILAITGTVMIFINPLITNQLTHTMQSFMGSMLIGSFVVINTIAIISVKKVYNQINKVLIAGTSAWICTLMFATILLVSKQPFIPSSITQPDVLRVILYMGILGTPIAYGLRNFGYQRIEASEATLFTYLQPLVYIPLGVLWLHESISTLQIVGLITITIGVFIAERRPQPSKIRDLT